MVFNAVHCRPILELGASLLRFNAHFCFYAVKFVMTTNIFKFLLPLNRFTLAARVLRLKALAPSMPMPMPLTKRRVLSQCALLGALLGAVLGPQVGQAQLRVDVTGLGVTLIPLNMNAFRDEPSAGQKISTIVQADLERAGQFKLTSTALTLDETSRPDFAALRARVMENFVSGSVTPLADGRFDVRFRLWDLMKSQDLGGASYAVSPGDLRRSAHQISDFIYEKLTGVKGIFSTRIAYVTKAKTMYHLWIADADGENAQAALSSPEPIISPSWSPDGQQLAYVSFETRKPVVYAQCGHWQAPHCGQFQRLQQRAGLGTRWSNFGRDLESRRWFTTLFCAALRRSSQPTHAKQWHRHRAHLHPRRQRHLLCQ